MVALLNDTRQSLIDEGDEEAARFTSFSVDQFQWGGDLFRPFISLQIKMHLKVCKQKNKITYWKRMKELNQIIEKEELTSVSVADLKRPLRGKNRSNAENAIENMLRWLKSMT
jgi:hypothetical protein